MSQATFTSQTCFTTVLLWLCKTVSFALNKPPISTLPLPITSSSKVLKSVTHNSNNVTETVTCCSSCGQGRNEDLCKYYHRENNSGKLDNKREKWKEKILKGNKWIRKKQSMLVTMAQEDEKMKTLTKNTQTERLSERLERIRKRARERKKERGREWVKQKVTCTAYNVCRLPLVTKYFYNILLYHNYYYYYCYVTIILLSLLKAVYF